jgi:hypothetical protein
MAYILQVGIEEQLDIVDDRLGCPCEMFVLAGWYLSCPVVNQRELIEELFAAAAVRSCALSQANGLQGTI